MRIGYVLLNFPALSETFIRREVLALCRAGHRVFVYAHFRVNDPLVPEPVHPNLVVRQVAFHRNVSDLVRHAGEDGVVHLHASLMTAAHRAAYDAGRVLKIPFSLTAYSGHDIFVAERNPLYRQATRDPLCAAVIVEDPFMRDWLVDRLGAHPDRIEMIANSFDLDLYSRQAVAADERRSDKIIILAIARFVEKKGLIHLVRAFNKLCGRRDDAELLLIGDGPEEPRLRRAAGTNGRIKFLGNVPEVETRRRYAEADIFCAPCVLTATGDADGVPTTVLEAMAFELPAVASDLLSTPHYVRHEQEGLLTRPGDVEAIAGALERLCADAALRETLGRNGRDRVMQLCDLSANTERLQQIITRKRQERWQEAIDALVSRRQTYTEAVLRGYDAYYARAVAFFKPTGRILDVGCGRGGIRHHMPPSVEYYGCDPVPLEEDADFPFSVAGGESLPYESATFDGVLLYSVLANVFDMDAVFKEVLRVLRPGGYLYVLASIDDPNPIHLNHFSEMDLRRWIGRYFSIDETGREAPNFMLVSARKLSVVVARSRPLVSVAVTTYNRERYISACIDSVLKQTYQPLEVVVVDDRSTDYTLAILDSFGEAIRVAVNDRNRGIAYTKNRALQMTSEGAKYVAILDSDDYWHSRFVEACADFLDAHPDVGLVYTDDIAVDADGRELRRQPAVEPWNVEAWLQTCNLRGDTWLARRDLVMQTALHDESLGFDVDYDLFYQLLEITSFAHLSEYLVYIREHPERSTRNQLELAKCHAANLVKYGYSPGYAYVRAQRNPEWIPAIEEGIRLGEKLREQRRVVAPSS